MTFAEHNDDLRERLKYHLTMDGVKAKKVASVIGVTPAIISNFKQGKFNLSEIALQKLDRYLTDKNR